MIGTLIFMILAYVIGSLSTGIILSKVAGLPDPRKSGSKNPGATNMTRVAGKGPGMAVFAGDAVKGFISVLIAWIGHITGPGLAFVALAAVLGHIFPVFHGFKGGKGVATAYGALLMLSFWMGLVVIAVGVALVYITRYVSVGSLVSIALAPFLMLVSGHSAYAFPLFLMALLIIWRHKDNIDRLKKGTENKIKN